MAYGVVFFPSFHDAIKELPDEQRLNIYDAIACYGLYGEIIEMQPVVKSLFALMKPVIDSSQNKYRAAKANGSKGGRGKKKQKENQNQNQNQNHDKDKEKDKEKDYEKDKESFPPASPRMDEETKFEKKRQAALDALMKEMHGKDITTQRS